MPDVKQFGTTELGREILTLMDCFTGGDGGVAFAKFKAYVEYLETYPGESRNEAYRNKILDMFKTINLLIATLNK